MFSVYVMIIRSNLIKNNNKNLFRNVLHIFFLAYARINGKKFINLRIDCKNDHNILQILPSRGEVHFRLALCLALTHRISDFGRILSVGFKRHCSLLLLFLEHWTTTCDQTQASLLDNERHEAQLTQNTLS